MNDTNGLDMGDGRVVAKVIRARIKAAGVNPKLVSVRSDYTSVSVHVKHWTVPLCKVEEITKGLSRVRRCEATGEILGGGNLFVHAQYETGALDELEALIRPEWELGEWRNTGTFWGATVCRQSATSPWYSTSVGEQRGQDLYDDASATRTMARLLASTGHLVGATA